jgi:hypothetical protein
MELPSWYSGAYLAVPTARYARRRGDRHMATDRRSLLEVDARGRISIGSLATHDRYLVEVEDDGTIVLTPAVVMSAVEARLHAATETSRRIDEFLDHPETGSRRTRPTRAMHQK